MHLTTTPEYDSGFRPVLPKTALAQRSDDLTLEAGLPAWTRGELFVKRLADVVIAGILIIPALPLIFLFAVLVRFTSHGPAFYTQVRLGRYGKPFVIWKLRTMTHDCEKTSGARWAARNDPRVTKIGRFLRITHLDELPQLWNVLRGDMSLVGPRPERPEFVPVLEASIPNYRQRLLVRPGVTGLAQIFLPPDTGLASVRKKLVYDLYYLRRRGFWLDLRLIFATGLQAVGLPCRMVQRMLFLPRPCMIEAVPLPDRLPALAADTLVEVVDDAAYQTRS